MSLYVFETFYNNVDCYLLLHIYNFITSTTTCEVSVYLNLHLILVFSLNNSIEIEHTKTKVWSSKTSELYTNEEQLRITVTMII